MSPFVGSVPTLLPTIDPWLAFVVANTRPCEGHQDDSGAFVVTYTFGHIISTGGI